LTGVWHHLKKVLCEVLTVAGMAAAAVQQWKQE